MLGSGIHGPRSVRRILLTRLRLSTRAGPKVSSRPDVSGLCRSPSPPSQVMGESLFPERYFAGFTRFSRLPTSLSVMPTRTPEGSDTLEDDVRSEEHTSELQSRLHLVCRLLLEKKK